MDYLKYTIQLQPEQSDIVLAFLSQLPFEAFQENEGELIAWLAAAEFSDNFKLQFADLKERFNLKEAKEVIKPQNWNAIWESSHKSISVGKFCQVRADFHEKEPDMQYDIIINPKMAFGTGHHETTYMMMDQMKSLKFDKKAVLDLGCGTGVLAILAAKMGSKDILAIDFDPAAYENTLENLKVNHLEGIKTQCGTLADTEDYTYDVILANINRSVILASLSTLYDKLKQDGTLLVSGILNSDEELLLQNATAGNFKQMGIQRKNGWICVSFMKA